MIWGAVDVEPMLIGRIAIISVGMYVSLVEIRTKKQKGELWKYSTASVYLYTSTGSEFDTV